MLLEINNLYRDRTAHDQMQAQIIRIDRERFEVTLRHMEGILETNTEILIKESANLSQIMGGSGYPTFLPTAPSNHPSNEAIWPVKVAYFGADKLPLMDVNIDLMLRPQPSKNPNDEWDNETVESPFHPTHYNIGTILPATISESPIKLRSGKHYYLVITTRRGWFYEKINIDPDTSQPGGWRLSWCLYRYRDNKLLDGKCN